MTRRDVLRLGAAGTGIFAIGGLTRVGGRAAAQSHAVPTDTIIAVHGDMPKKHVMPSTGTRVIFGA